MVERLIDLFTMVNDFRKQWFSKTMALPVIFIMVSSFVFSFVTGNVGLAQSQEPSDLSVVVGEVQIDGGFQELTDATKELIAPFHGRRTTVEELYDLAERLEQLYQEAGYFLVRVTIPPQEVNDGDTFHLLVIDGYLEGVDLQGVSARSRDRVSDVLSPIVNRKRLTMDDFERVLMLANETPGTTIRTTLAPGDGAGTSLLVVEGDHTPWNGSVSLSAPLTHEGSPVSGTLQAQLNQPFGQGEQIRANVSGRDLDQYTVGGGARWPLGSDGVSIDLSVSHSHTFTPLFNLFIPSTRSGFQRYALELNKPIKLGRTHEFRLSGSLEAIQDVLEVPDFSAKLHEDKLRVLRFGANVMQNTAGGSRWTLAMQLSQGIPWGARTIEDVLETGIHFSRIGSTPIFQSLSATATWRLPVASRVSFTSTLRGQYALKGPLPTAALFGISGGHALPSVALGVGAGDHGWTLREEVETTQTLFDGRLNLTALGYAAIGATYDVLWDTKAFASAIGLGVRGDFGRVRLSLDYGRGWSEALSDDSLMARVEVIF